MVLIGTGVGSSSAGGSIGWATLIKLIKAIITVAKNLKLVEKQPEETEVLELKHLPFQQAYEMVLNGEIADSMSVAGILKAKMLFVWVQVFLLEKIWVRNMT